MDATNLAVNKGDRSNVRRKGIEKELRNLNFNINYEKGSVELGPSGDS